MEGRGQFCEVGSFFPLLMWVVGLNLEPQIYCKSIYLPSHVSSGPVRGFVFSEVLSTEPRASHLK